MIFNRHSRKTTTRRALVALGATAMLALAQLGAGATSGAAPEANAQSSAANFLANPERAAQEYVNQLNGSSSDAREFLANELRNAAKHNPQFAAILKQIEKIAPGLLPTPKPVPKPTPKPEPKPAPKPAPKPKPRNTPCPAYAKACVDLKARKTWIQKNGKTVYGPVSHAPGKPGQETPRGEFTVKYKVKDEISREFNNAPMPNAVYFTYNGHAFHYGDISYLSAGCIRLPWDASVYYFNNLNPGDIVYIW